MGKVTKIKWTHDATKGAARLNTIRKKKRSNPMNWRPTPKQAQSYKDRQILNEILQHID